MFDYPILDGLVSLQGVVLSTSMIKGILFFNNGSVPDGIEIEWTLGTEIFVWNWSVSDQFLVTVFPTRLNVCYVNLSKKTEGGNRVEVNRGSLSNEIGVLELRKTE